MFRIDKTEGQPISLLEVEIGQVVKNLPNQGGYAIGIAFDGGSASTLTYLTGPTFNFGTHNKTLTEDNLMTILDDVKSGRNTHPNKRHWR